MSIFDIYDSIIEQLKNIASRDKYSKHDIVKITDSDFYKKIFQDEELVKGIIAKMPETDFCEITDISCAYVTTTHCKCVKTMLFGRTKVVTDILHAHTPICGDCIKTLGNSAKICKAHIETETTSFEEDEISKLQQTIKDLRANKEELQNKLNQQLQESSQQLIDLQTKFDAEKLVRETAENQLKISQAELLVVQEERNSLVKEKEDFLGEIPELIQQNSEEQSEQSMRDDIVQQVVFDDSYNPLEITGCMLSESTEEFSTTDE